MSAATAQVIDLSAYRRRRVNADTAPVAAPAAMPMPVAWVPTMVLVPVYFVPMH